MNTDKFVHLKHLSLTRLIDEYTKHKSLVIGFDFDGTINDFHNEGYSYDETKQLLRDLKEIGCKLVCWTAYKDLDEVALKLKEWEIPYDSINEGGINLGYESKKPFFNALLDDRSGLHQVFTELRMLVDWVRSKDEPMVKMYTSPELEPNKPKTDIPTYRIFLAGSIDQGKFDWQKDMDKIIEDKLKPFKGSFKIVLYNPRRVDWDSSIGNDIGTKEFVKQVTWERNYLKDADFILFNFEPFSSSPVTLLELGESLGKNDKIVVRCPSDFYRKGNVDIACQDHSVKVFETLDETINELIQNIIHINLNTDI